VFDAALNDLRVAGAVVEEVQIELPDPIEFFIQYWGGEFGDFAAWQEELGVDVWPSSLDLARRAAQLTGEQVSHAIRRTRADMYNAFRSAMASFDALATLTTPYPAFPHVGDIGGLEVVDGTPIDIPGLFFHHLTESPTHAGLPAASVPCGFTDAGLPIGLQIIGHALDDVGVVRVASRYEQATSWTERHPTF
jgi:Asp-tRNA(Asn)/Glu-tRNA(Gln) amidotransferase A subunit family amidase